LVACASIGSLCLYW